MIATNRQKGDTLIEVIIAIAIFSLVTVSMFGIMQRGSGSAYESLERSQVRMLINAQSEYLSYLRDQYNSLLLSNLDIDRSTFDRSISPSSPAGQWLHIKNNIGSTGAPASDACVDNASGQSFFLRRSDSGIEAVVGSPHAAGGIPEPGVGLWIQKVDPSGYSSLSQKYHDFYLMSCWTTVGNQKQTLSTIVRLYEPR